MGIDEGRAKTESLVEAATWDDANSLRTFLQNVDTALHRDEREAQLPVVQLKDQLPKGRKPEEVFNLLYGLEYLRPRYVLRWEAKTSLCFHLGSGERFCWCYTSDETGGYEVYVRSFPSGSGPWLVSTKGGVLPQWRRDGKELFYRSADGKLMAVEVKSGVSFEVGPPRPLFEFRSGTGVSEYATYTVTADGQRFLLNTLVDESGGAPLTVVVNWTAELKR